MRQAQYIMIESNYDKEMLLTGKYPEYLKARILADKGHLDNEVTARYIAEIYTPKLTHVFLCHLSNDNNTPNIALATVTKPLFERGLKIGDATESATSNDADIQITPLPRLDSSILYILRAK
jgi:phosphoribosyl 1,2-cyclic phosphodiesterase